MSVFTITIKLYNFSFELILNPDMRFDVIYFAMTFSAYIKTYSTIQKHILYNKIS